MSSRSCSITFGQLEEYDAHIVSRLETLLICCVGGHRHLDFIPVPRAAVVSKSTVRTARVGSDKMLQSFVLKFGECVDSTGCAGP